MIIYSWIVLDSAIGKLKQNFVPQMLPNVWTNHNSYNLLGAPGRSWNNRNNPIPFCWVYSTLWIHILFFHSSVDGFWGYFCFLAIMKNVAVNIHVYVFVWIGFSSPGYIPRSGIVGSLGNSHIWGTYWIACCSGYTTLHSHPQCLGFISPYLCQHLLLSLFWILAILVGEKS